jgi:type III pantothenate kinase
MSEKSRQRRLLLDVGNSRVKWAFASEGGVGRQRSLPVSAAGELPIAALLAALPKGIGAVRLVSVGRPARTRALERALAQVLDVEVRRLRTTVEAAGVRCGYREPWRLGADRWAAVIGARHLHASPRAACIVDIGTAMTIDFLSRDGRHGGGVIVPAPALMVEALLRDTQGIRRRAAPGRGGPGPGAQLAPRTPEAPGRRGPVRGSLFARSTREAIEQGSQHAAAALIERAWRAAHARYGGRPRLLLTGGGAARLLPLLDAPGEIVPDLVLRGLAALD